MQTIPTIRQPAVAGSFYAAAAQDLSADVALLLAQTLPTSAQLGAAPDSAPKCLIVPHAGYIYSGATAALGFQSLISARHRIRRVVLLGPAHRVPVRGLALPGVDFFATPLGQVAIDPAAVAAVANLPQVVVSPAAHAQEHALEVQLPFLQVVLDDFKLLPLVVGEASAAEVAEVLEAVWGGPETLIVVSSDLSHYLPYAAAQAKDSQTTQRILQLQPSLTHDQACGGTPINGLLLAARRHHLQPQLLQLCNSGDTAGDTAGDKARVVGYAAFAFVPDQRGQHLPPLARAAIAEALVSGHGPAAALGAGPVGSAWPDSALTALARAGAPSSAQAWLHEPGACFVTLTQQQQLRGCIGTLEARRSLLADLMANAVAAALHDPRFAPLTLAELELTDIEVSVLSPMQPMHFSDEAQALSQLRPGVDGVVFEFERYRSTFLPQVWEQLPAPAEFMAHLKRKAGLPANFWHPGVRLQRYTVRHWSEQRLEPAVL